MDKQEFQKILEAHKKWLSSKDSGERAYLREADLRGANLTGAYLWEADLREANLRGANLTEADLSRANLTEADLTGAYLWEANLREANLRGANLWEADLTEADLSRADLTRADLTGANLTGSNLTRADLSRADLSNSQWLIVAIDYMARHFEKTQEGYIAYKQFGMHRHPNPKWEIEAGAVISEVVNPNRADDCGCGVNVGTKRWVGMNLSMTASKVWKCLIRWEWLPGVVVPYNTDGKIRCERVELICEVE